MIGLGFGDGKIWVWITALSLAGPLHQSSVLSPNATRKSLTGSEVYQEATLDNEGIGAMHDP